MNEWYDAEQRAERSQQLYESQRWEEALAEINAALEINPGNPSWLAYRGFLLDNLDRMEEAVEAYQDALDLQPDDVDVAIALGIDLTRLGRHRRALSVFERVATTEPHNEAAYCHRILNYAELGEHELAEEMFYLAQQLREDCPDCFFHMGLSLAARGTYERALYCWSRALEIEPGYPGVRQHIARAYALRGEMQKARESYLAELRDDPGNTRLLVEMGELAIAAGDLAGAASRFRQVLELDPEHVGASSMLADVLVRLGDAPAALNLLLVLQESAPGAPLIEERLGETYLALAQYEQARKHLERAVDRDPDSATALMSLGTCLLHMGHPDEATDLFTRMLAMDDESPHTHHNLAVCHFLADRYESGLWHCLRAIDLKPDYGLAISKAAVAHIHLAQWSEAREMISRGLELDSDDHALQQLSARLWRYRCVHCLLRLIRIPMKWLRRS